MSDQLTTDQFTTDRPLRGLIAEDEGIIAMVLRRTLAVAGYEIAGMVATGVEAVRLARETNPDFIVMDHNMPLMNGVKATQQILSERSIPIIMLTAYGDQEIIESAKAAGACGYLIKPIVGTVLIEKIKECITAYGEGKTVFPQLDTPLSQTIG